MKNLILMSAAVALSGCNLESPKSNLLSNKDCASLARMAWHELKHSPDHANKYDLAYEEFKNSSSLSKEEINVKMNEYRSRAKGAGEANIKYVHRFWDDGCEPKLTNN
ncbi:hypothetical protein FCV55_07120 [Vibrio sp. F13]|uniref:hypothetical protein n=1 Tax=Vibrio sp. F13 TaxID=2070777 RepID=UPI0010BD4E1C|nr:hypothetical protein [Vibrio sp. F13]TKF71731.1 hypothetical protein FCV55_07120 [Vibrio sp. F13]